MTEQTSYPKISRMAVTSQYFGIFSVASVFLFFLLGIPMALLAALSLSCMSILFAHLSGAFVIPDRLWSAWEHPFSPSLFAFC